MAISSSAKLSEILAEWNVSSLSAAASAAGLSSTAKLSDFIGLSAFGADLSTLPDHYAVGGDYYGLEFAYIKFKTDGTWELYSQSGNTASQTGRWLDAGEDPANYYILCAYGQVVMGSPDNITGWDDLESFQMLGDHYLGLGTYSASNLVSQYFVFACGPMPFGSPSQTQKTIQLSARVM